MKIFGKEITITNSKDASGLSEKMINNINQSFGLSFLGTTV